MSVDSTARLSIFRISASALAAAVKAARGVTLEVPRLESWPGAAARDDLLQRAVQEARLQGRNPVQALADAIAGIHVLDAASKAVAGELRQAALKELDRGHELEASGCHEEAQLAFARAQGSLDAVVAEANQLLCPAERKLAGQALATAMRDLGYGDLRESRRGDLRARRSDGKLVYVSLDRRAERMEVGLGGHDGLTCEFHQQEIFEALRRRGLEFAEVRTESHGLCRGGPIAERIRHAAREGASPGSRAEPGAQEGKGATLAARRRNLLGRR